MSDVDESKLEILRAIIKESHPVTSTSGENHQLMTLELIEDIAKRTEALERRIAAIDSGFEVLDPSTARMVKAIGLEKVAADGNGDLRLVTGIVLEPDVTDSQGDTYTAEDIRKTAHLYMLDYRNLKKQHRTPIDDEAGVVESYIVPADCMIGDVAVKAGTWVMTAKIFSDEIWESIKDNELTGFSIGGFAKRTAITQQDDAK